MVEDYFPFGKSYSQGVVLVSGRVSRCSTEPKVTLEQSHWNHVLHWWKTGMELPVHGWSSSHYTYHDYCLPKGKFLARHTKTNYLQLRVARCCTGQLAHPSTFFQIPSTSFHSYGGISVFLHVDFPRLKIQTLPPPKTNISSENWYFL